MDHLSLARLLSAATRLVIERMHNELAEAGHPDLRPAYGYAVLAIGTHELTTAQLATHLEMTKQGAGKLVTTLEELGYVERRAHEGDGRAQLLALTARGEDLVKRSAAAQDAIEREWEATIGKRNMQVLRSGLERAIEAHGTGEHLQLRPIW